MVYHLEVEREEDGRWLAEVVDLPGVMAYGATAEQAVDNGRRLPCASSPTRSTASSVADAVRAWDWPSRSNRHRAGSQGIDRNTPT